MSNEIWRIRSAVPDDCAAVLQLIKDLAVYEKEPESVVEISEAVLKQDCFGEESWCKCLVAEEEIVNHCTTAPLPAEVTGQVKLVGYAMYFNTYSTWQGRMLFLEDLYVAPESRDIQMTKGMAAMLVYLTKEANEESIVKGKGIGTAILKQLAKIAKEKGCCKIKWNVLYWNQSAIDFYESIGTEMQPDWRLFCLGKSAMLKMADRDTGVNS